MLAIRPLAPGGPEILEPRELDSPPLGAGEARIRVAFAGINFIDVYHRTGLYKLPAPIALGSEGSGTVEEVGPGVTLSVGTRVAWCGVAGSYATEIVAPVDRLVTLPPAISLEDAAAAMLQGLTAHYLATSTFALGPTHTCLVHAAAGGVGLLLGQLAHRAGATAIGTVSTDAKSAAALAAGYAHVIRYDRDPLVASLRALVPTGVDVVYDSVGAATFDHSLDCLRPRGLMVLFGAASGPVPPFDPQVLNRKGSLFLTRPTLGAYTATRAELLARADAILGAIARGEFRITIDRILPLDQAADAHRLLESRATSGKLLLRC